MGGTLTIYLVSNNGKLTKENGVLQYSDYLGNTSKLIPDQITQIIVFGKLEITGSAFNLIFLFKIALYFLSKNGRFNSKLVFDETKNVILKHRQHLIYEDISKKTQISKDIIRGKIHNEFLYLQRIKRTREVPRSFIQLEYRMKELRQKLESSDNLDEIRGIEGSAARAYFQAYGSNLLPNWIKFTKRTKNPPEDPVNSALSFLYTVLASYLDKEIIESGLDDTVACLHSLSYGRKSLVFDLEEEFRTPIVDTLVASLFNQGTLKKQDFRFEDKTMDEEFFEEEKLEQVEILEFSGVFLNEDGMKKTLNAFEKKLNQIHYYSEKNKSLSYRKIIRYQVQLYKAVITGQREHYLPLVVK